MSDMLKMMKVSQAQQEIIRDLKHGSILRNQGNHSFFTWSYEANDHSHEHQISVASFNCLVKKHLVWKFRDIFEMAHEHDFKRCLRDTSEQDIEYTVGIQHTEDYKLTDDGEEVARELQEKDKH
jgi:hypothetical protein